MVISCSAIGCTNRYYKNNVDIHFHRYPFSRPEILTKWIAATRREKWKPTRNGFLCSDHFRKECYETRLGAGRLNLKVDVMPELFNYPERLLKTEKQRRILKPIITTKSSRKKIKTNIQDVQVQQIASTTCTNLNDNHIATSACELNALSPEKKKLKRNVKTLQQKLWCKNAKIFTMKELIKKLKYKRKYNRGHEQ